MFRSAFQSGLLALTICCSSAFAEDVRIARKTLDKAIEALGGAKLIQEKPALTGNSQGIVHVLNQTVKAQNEFTVQGLRQLRWSSQVTINNNQTTLLVVLNGEKGWLSANNQPANPLPKEQIKIFGDLVEGLRLSETLTPMRGKEWTLSSLGELRIDGRLATGIKATRKGLPSIDMYLDAKTHLPVRVEMRTKSPDGMENLWTAHLSGYQKKDGRQYFTKLKVLMDGNKVIDMERSDIKSKDKMDDISFAKP